MFSLKVEGGGFIAMFAILYLLWDLTYTMNDIGYWAMLPALTSVPKERANVTTLANLFAGVGAILTMGLVPLFTAGDLTIGGNAIIAYAVIAIICAAAFIGCQMLTVFGVKENHQPSTEKGEPTKFKKLFKIIFRNKQLLWITLVMLLFNLGRFLIMGFATTFVYLQFGYAGMYATIVVLIYALPNIFVNIVYPAIAKKFTRKQIEIISTVISVVGYVLLFALGFNFIALCAAILLLSTGQTLFYVLLTIALSNTVHYFFAAPFYVQVRYRASTTGNNGSISNARYSEFYQSDFRY
jgi:melibiose permease/lactose/raffinose/galactose permease